MKQRKRIRLVVSSLMMLLSLEIHAQVGADGKTFEQRRQIWLNGPRPQDVTSPITRLEYLSQWLENGLRGDIVDETLDFLLQFEKGQRVQWGLRAFYLIKFGRRYGNGALPTEKEDALKQDLQEWISEAKYFGPTLQPNKQMWAMTAMNLYASAFDPVIEIPQFGCKGPQGHCENLGDDAHKHRRTWGSFLYNGHSYGFGSGPHNAREFSRDFLMHKIDSWLVGKISAVSPNGPREFHSINYSRAFVCSLILLAEGLKIARVDEELQQRALMAADLVILDHAMDYTANALGGNLGRSDFRILDSDFKFPLHVYFGLGEQVTRYGVEDVFMSDWKPNPVIADLAVLSDERDDYWEVNLEYLDSETQHPAGEGKYTYRTKYFSLGSGTRWQAVVKGDNERSWLRFWINAEESEPPPKQETRYLGTDARQFRNALFCKLTGQPFYNEIIAGQAAQWDVQEHEDGWHFKKQGKVMVAIAKAAGAASVEIGIEGVDGSWDEFKTRIKANAALSRDGYTTSRGDFIGENDTYGIEQPGDLVDEFPFPRMKVVNSEGNVLVDYRDDKLVMQKDGRRHVLDFSKWQGLEPPPVTRVPDKPQNLSVVEIK